MRVLIDACLPVQLKGELPFDAVSTAREMGWQHLKNGELLAAADTRFDILITVDKSIPAQQKVSQFAVAVLILRARSNRLPDLLPLIPAITAALPRLKAGTVYTIP